MKKLKTYKINSQIHRIYPVKLEEVLGKGGINNHRAWYCEINNIYIISNDDVLGNKFYIYNAEIEASIGESNKTKWYKSPTAAAIAFFQLKNKALFN